MRTHTGANSGVAKKKREDFFWLLGTHKCREFPSKPKYNSLTFEFQGYKQHIPNINRNFKGILASMSEKRRIVIALDDSSCSKDTLQWALKAGIIKADDELRLLTVLEPHTRPIGLVNESAAIDSGPSNNCKPSPFALDRAKTFLQSCKKAVTDKGMPDVKTDIIVSCIGGSSDMGRHICEYSERQQAELLVMGSRGLGTMKRVGLGLIGLGSCSDYVVKNAHVNVLVHKERND